ncbi:MAG: proton-conducting transporter membrane subunit [Brachymonas sp.]|nr:proton-conducting transporter membrane subunit [Brachymonas sp.]
MASIDPRLPPQTLTVAERAAWVALPVAGLVALLMLLAQGALPWTFNLPWVPALNMGFDLRIDGLSALMLLLILGVGSAVFVYAGGYLAGHPQQRRAYLLLTLFATAMVGCVSADNLLLLFLFWELTSLLSFLLIGFHHHEEDSRKSAQQSMLVTGAGGLAMLGGFVVLGQLTGTWRISAIIEQLPALPDSTALRAAVALVMAGAFAKSAQFPFHFWLPGAMAAPTPVSAYLHSATMVKLGVYLLARLDAGMDGFGWWQTSLQLVGCFTAVWGMVLALRERDLKRILAWSTVATLGVLVFVVGLPGYQAAAAVATLLLAHAMYKATLFFVAGNVDHGTGTRLIDALGLLRKHMPLTAAAALLAGLSMAGLPGTFGFIAKEVLHSAEANAPHLAMAGPAMLLFGAIGVAVAATVAWRIFWQARNTAVLPAPPHEGGLALAMPPLALASLGLLTGLFPSVVSGLVQQAALAMHPAVGVTPVQLALNGPVLLAELLPLLINLGLGLVIFLLWELLHRLLDTGLPHIPSGPGVFQKALQLLSWAAVNTSRRLQHGRLSGYHGLMMGGIMAGVLAAMLGTGAWALPAFNVPSWGATLACGVIVLGAILALHMQSRISFVLASGLVGYGSAALFLFAGAPDLAFTQFSMETVMTVVITATLLIVRLGGKPDKAALPATRWGHALVAVLSATVITGLLLAVLAQPFNNLLGSYYGEQSVPAAHGHNVVNVILVDFRGFDTLGESSVVFFALMSALPLLAAARAARKKKAQANQQSVSTEPAEGGTP